MKVLLLNGSPKAKGCTYTALSTVAAALEENGIETEIIHAGKNIAGGCLGCGACSRLGKCVQNDVVNEISEKLDECDGVVFGSPVHYAGASGMLTSVLDRLFYSSGAKLTHKPGAAVFSARRGGLTSSFDQINKYFTINQMPVVSSTYWNGVHGNTPDEVMRDEEGMQVMRILGKNLAWLLKCIDAGKAGGITPPAPEPKVRTNFIR